MTILFTGMSGIEIEKSLRLFSSQNKHLRKYGLSEPLVIKFDSKIKEVFFEDEDNKETLDTSTIWTDKILELSYPKLKNYWTKAFLKVQEEVKNAQANNPDRVIFINLHACYFHNETQEYISLLNLEKIKLLKPKMIITLIDDIYEIHHRLSLSGGIFHKNNEPNSIEFILRHIRLLDWRSKETLLSRFYTENLENCFHYLFAVKHSKETLHNLIFENRRTVYLSHPITEVRRLIKDKRDEEAKKIMTEITDISEELTLRFTAFLPTTIDEFRIDFTSKEVEVETKKGKKILVEQIDYFTVLTERWENQKYLDDKHIYIKSGFKDNNKFWQPKRSAEIDSQTNNLLAVLSDLISDQVTVRDYTLTEQSDFLVLYRPLFNGNPSKGVRKELSYFKRMKKDAELPIFFFIYSPSDDIDNFYVRQYVKRLENENKLGHIELDSDLKDLTSELRSTLLKAKSNKNQLYSFFDLVQEQYNLHILDRTGRKTPLGDDHYKEYRKDFSQRYYEGCEEIYNLYTENCSYFEVDKSVSIIKFVDKVESYLKKHHKK